MQKKLLSRLIMISATLLFLSFTACGGTGGGDEDKSHEDEVEDKSSKPGSIKLKIQFKGQRAKPSLFSAKFVETDETEIKTVFIKASWDGGDADSMSCRWNCELKNLPSGKSINLKLSGKDKKGVEISDGGSEVTLKSGETTDLTLFLYSKKNPYPHLLENIALPGSIYTSESVQIKVVAADGDSDRITVTLTSSLNGSFSPSSAIVEFDDDSSSEFATTYTAGPNPGTDTISLTVTDDEELSATYTAEIEIKERPAGTAPIQSNAGFPPDVEGIHAETTGGRTTFTASVSDKDSGGGAVIYKWSVNDVLSGTAESVTVDTPLSGDRIKVEVSDAGGASRSYTIIWSGN